MPLRSSLLPNATPWARASNNVKKTQSQMCEKTRFKIFCKTKQKHFWFQSHISILRLAFVKNEFQQTKKTKNKICKPYQWQSNQVWGFFTFWGDLAFCAPSDVFYDWEWKWSTLNWGVKRQPLPPSAPRAAAASRGTTAAQKNLFEPVSNFSDLVLANGCTLEYAIFLDYATFAYVHIRGNFLFRSVSGP